MTAESKKNAGVLQATTRDEHGKGSSRALRREGKVPAIIYGKGHEPISVALYLKEVAMEYARGRFRSRVVDINISGKTVKALPKDVQFNPVSDIIEHVDFIKVDANTALRVMVPVKFLGQEKSLGLKRGGVLNIVRHEVEFFCAPDSIPSVIEINIQNMDIGASLHIKDVELPKGVTPTIKRNFTIATIAGRRKEEEEAKTAEGAAPAAAAAAPAAAKAGAAAPAAAKAPAAKK